MSGKEEPKPRAPLVFKKSKFDIKVALRPVESVQAAALTVLPSSEEVKAEDEGAAPRYESVAPRVGMFKVSAVAATSLPPGQKVVKKQLTQAERLARPLANDSDEEEEEAVRTVATVAREMAPTPPPLRVAPIAAEPVRAVALPSVAKEFLGVGLQKEKKKSYAEGAIRKRLTNEFADTLIELGNQIDEMKLSGLDLEEGSGLTAEGEKVEGRTKYVFDNDASFLAPLSDTKLTALDDLFASLRIRMNAVLGEGDIAVGSESPISKDLAILRRLIAYAPKYKQRKPERDEAERIAAINDMMTDEIANTLLELESSLIEMGEAGIDFGSMTMTKGEGDKVIYEFTDGNTFLPARSAEEQRKAEEKLAVLNRFFTNGTKISLRKMEGLGEYDVEGTPLQSDLVLLTELFKIAKGGKEAVAVAATAATAEAAVTKTLVGTEYETLAKPIDEEMHKSPYEITTTSAYRPGTYKDKKGADVTLPVQKGFIPSTRRAFGYFIKDKYSRYMLKALDKLDPNACAKMGDSSTATQIYEYQKFVRDYISFMTPYRGVLVYHGLGSGKTCTAIAASEALLSSGGKKRIIVMTPFSLRKNFIQQITFCGFRHFRLFNYWTAHQYKAADGKNALWLFATTVLRIPESYLKPRRGRAVRIWIPDLTKPQSEENYTRLPGDQQAEIRDQIYETLVYDPYKGKNGLIWFLNYNGISASKLRDLACKVPSDVFDNAVIVVDEIHNLIRLMQGTIDPYLKKMYTGEVEAEIKGDTKYLDTERITSTKWRPKFCGKTMNYKRGYIFYRLLLEAKNSKIVGLSGTPLINFPEELGILANILHGYNYTFRAGIPKISEPDGNKKIEQLLRKFAEGNDPSNFCEDIDFYDVSIDDRKAVIDFTFTFLPEGYKKVQGQLGVERIPFTEQLKTTGEKLTVVRGCIDTILKSINKAYSFTREFIEKAEPLLPVMGEPSIPETATLDDSFKGRFINPNDGVSIINEQILLKRLSGLISYYKGSRKDLMPEVKKGDDIVVRVPMSLEQQKKYIAVRLAEIKVEEQKEKSKKGGPEARSDDSELKKLSSSQNYRMASRQACNFVFPDGFTRPRPLTAKQAKEADEFGGQVENMTGEEQSTEQSALVRSKEEEEAEIAEAKQQQAQIAQEEEELSRIQEEEEVKAKREELKGRLPGEIEAAVQEIRNRYEQDRLGGLILASAIPELVEEATTTTGATTGAADMSDEQRSCLANILPNESYQQAINRSKNCLLKYGLAKLALKDTTDPSRPSPLARCSPKYKAILENMEGVKGSSLVYSQFLGMEGIGIFTIAMQANGYEPIKIISREGEFMFDEVSEVSIRKGPGDATKENKRFILFTGGEEEDIRKINIDIFNAKFGELPPKIKGVLEESGFTKEIGNKRGELCKVFCITSAGAEGLSLKNVRSVHIMEPYWNDVRMAQVKGRAVRICSHQELPLQDRNVKIFTYLSVFSHEAQKATGADAYAIPQNIWMRDSISGTVAKSYGLTIAENKGEYVMTSDERLFYISERKKKLVENLIIIMKTAATDCLLNYKENRDGTFMCRLLGNEGDFLYHPNLQKDIETSKKDDIGNIFEVPKKEIERIEAEDARLRFEEEEDAAETTTSTSTAAAAAATVAATSGLEEAPAMIATSQLTSSKPVRPPVATTQVKQQAPALPPTTDVQIRYQIKVTDEKTKTDKDYIAYAKPNTKGVVSKFFVYNLEDKEGKGVKESARAVGTINAQFDAEKKRWIPKRGTFRQAA